MRLTIVVVVRVDVADHLGISKLVIQLQVDHRTQIDVGLGLVFAIEKEALQREAVELAMLLGLGLFAGGTFAGGGHLSLFNK